MNFFDDRDEKIHAMLRAGEQNMRQIGEEFGLTRERIRQISERDNVPCAFVDPRIAQKAARKEEVEERKRKRDGMHENISRLRSQGLTFKQISIELFGSDENWRRVQSSLDNRGQTTPKDRSDRDRMIKKARADGASLVEIMTYFNVKHANLYRILSK